MKRYLTAGMVALLVLTASSAMALQVKMNYFSSERGEYSAAPIDFQWVLSNYAPAAKYTKDNTTYFQTFCIEKK